MKPFFPRVNYGINSALGFYKIDCIVDFFDLWSGKQDWWSIYATDAIKDAERAFNAMADEISQTIHTCNENTQVELFEWLKDWMGDYRIASVAEELIIEEVALENAKRMKQFNEKVAEEQAKFHESPKRKLKHKEEYIDEQIPLLYSSIEPWMYRMIYPNSEKKINYNFYCVKEEPGLLPESLLPKYFVLVDDIIRKFRNAAAPYIKRYDAGSIVPSHHLRLESIVIERKALPVGETKTAEVITERKTRRSRKKKTPATANRSQTFDKLLSKQNGDFILQMLEDLSITVNGAADLSERKKGAILGVTEALKEKNILPLRPVQELYCMIGQKINLTITKLNSSDIADEYKKKAIQYIAEHRPL